LSLQLKLKQPLQWFSASVTYWKGLALSIYARRLKPGFRRKSHFQFRLGPIDASLVHPKTNAGKFS
jgi:hypothetical protein